MIDGCSRIVERCRHCDCISIIDFDDFSIRNGWNELFGGFIGDLGPIDHRCIGVGIYHFIFFSFLEYKNINKNDLYFYPSINLKKKDKMEMKYKKIGFHIIEFCLFVSPAIPDSLSVRLGILLVYFIGHCFKVQVAYLIYKKKCLLYEVPYPDPNSD
jgi:hypothetical protein